MNKTWFIGDTHFRHNNVLNFENRPFAHIDEMEEKMIQAWNSVVGKHDTVYMLGDFCFGNKNEWIEILDQLKGEFHLIKGNHDKSKIIERVKNDGYIKEIHYVGHYIKLGNFQLHLTHYPLSIGERPFLANISGHIHSLPSQFKNQFNVGVDSDLMKVYYELSKVDFGTPIDLDSLMEIVQSSNDKISDTYKKGS